MTHMLALQRKTVRRRLQDLRNAKDTAQNCTDLLHADILHVQDLVVREHLRAQTRWAVSSRTVTSDNSDKNNEIEPLVMFGRITNTASGSSPVAGSKKSEQSCS